MILIIVSALIRYFCPAQPWKFFFYGAGLGKTNQLQIKFGTYSKTLIATPVYTLGESRKIKTILLKMDAMQDQFIQIMTKNYPG